MNPANSRPPTYDELLRHTRRFVVDQLSSLVLAVLGKADDWIFDLAQKEGEGADPFARSPRLEAMNSLRATRATIERQFARQYEALFDELIEPRPLAVDGASLSLVGEEELEQQLASDLIVEALQRAHGHTLDALARGMAKLMGTESLAPRQNPLSALNFGHGLHRALKGIELPNMLQVVLYKYYERELLQRFPEIIEPLSQRFAAAGLVPRGGPGVVPRAAAPSRPAGTPTAGMASAHAAEAGHGTAAPGGGWQGHAAAVPEDANVFALLREMLRALRPAQAVADGVAAGGGEHGGRRPLATNEMLSVLSLMQAEVPPSVLETMERHEASLSVLLKRDLLQSASRIGLSPEQVRISPDEEDAVDLVGMLFDVLFDEHDFEQRARNLVSRLVVPYVKVALLDRRMFMYRTHPARRLLNAVTEACEGNAGQSAQEREMLGKAEQVVDTLVSEFNEDVAIFETLEAELRGFLEQQRKRIELAEKRAAEAQRGQERLEHARLQAGGELASRIDGRRVPAALREFLARSWSHHLSLVALRDGTESDAWNGALALADKLLDLLPGGRAAGVSVGTAMQGLGADIVAVLASSGVQGEAADTVIKALADGIEAQRRGDAQAAQQAAAVLRVAPEPPPVPQPPRLKVVAGTEVAPAFDPDDLVQLRQLKVGDWIALAGEDEKFAPAKLAWISPISNRLMFVNRRGVRMLVASVEELGVLKKQGKLQLRDAQGGAFEDALQRMVGRLKQDIA
ncbi:DUF1631 family protein [Silanimonas lenta]|uniref:DUF1631 family protein n=1 Tax=Silanimonas lenta TaxID=265429 RepID=UPI00041ED3E0|nr:DUF1631 family protein [Silanimonas lenta]